MKFTSALKDEQYQEYLSKQNYTLQQSYHYHLCQSVTKKHNLQYVGLENNGKLVLVAALLIDVKKKQVKIIQGPFKTLKEDDIVFFLIELESYLDKNKIKKIEYQPNYDYPTNIVDKLKEINYIYKATTEVEFYHINLSSSIMDSQRTNTLLAKRISKYRVLNFLFNENKKKDVQININESISTEFINQSYSNDFIDKMTRYDQSGHLFTLEIDFKYTLESLTFESNRLFKEIEKLKQFTKFNIEKIDNLSAKMQIYLDWYEIIEQMYKKLNNDRQCIAIGYNYYIGSTAYLMDIQIQEGLESMGVKEILVAMMLNAVSDAGIKQYLCMNQVSDIMSNIQMETIGNTVVFPGNYIFQNKPIKKLIKKISKKQ